MALTSIRMAHSLRHRLLVLAVALSKGRIKKLHQRYIETIVARPEGATVWRFDLAPVLYDPTLLAKAQGSTQEKKLRYQSPNF